MNRFTFPAKGVEFLRTFFSLCMLASMLMFWLAGPVSDLQAQDIIIEVDDLHAKKAPNARNLQGQSMNLYPNPAYRHDRVQLEVPSDEPAQAVEVMDVQGRRLARAEGNFYRASLRLGQSRPAQVYLIRLYIGKEVYTRKLLLQNQSSLTR